MKFKKGSKFTVTIMLVLTLVFAMGATAIGAYAAPPNADTSWLAMGGTGQPNTYSQQGYYQGKYIFELGWNLNEKGFNAYPDKAKLTLSDNSTITVSFDKSCKSQVQNTAVLADLKSLIERLNTENINSMPLVKPLVVSVTYIGNKELVKLADEYYTNGNLTKFSAIFSSLGSNTQKAYCTKMIEDGKTAFISGCAENMKSDMLDYCAEKTYQEGKIALFSCIAPYLSNDQKQTWVVRASRDNKNTFLAVLTQQAPSSKSIQSAGILPNNLKEIAISFNIDNGGLEILPANSNEITASYDSEYYDVDIANKNGKLNISILGKVSMMGKTNDVQLYVPDVKYMMDVNVLNGNFSYALPEDCTDEITITAQNAGIAFTSKNQYKNSAISLIAKNKDFIKYEPPVFPNYFTKTNTGFKYTNGTGKNKIKISLIGYTSVNFMENAFVDNTQSVGSSKQKITRQESLVIGFAPFNSYGLVYNPKLDRAFWNGQEVKAFVDIRQMFPGGAYSFNLGYIEPKSSSTLYIMAVRNNKGLITGIQKMSKELQNDLYGIADETSQPEPHNPDLEAEINGSEGESPVNGEKYIVFDGTSSLRDLSITATDKFSSTDIPKTVADWISNCQGSSQVYVKKQNAGEKVDAWIYYNSDNRMAWTMNTDGTTLKFMLTDNVPKTVNGATLIHYQAPVKYKDLEVFFKSEKLKLN